MSPDPKISPPRVIQTDDEKYELEFDMLDAGLEFTCKNERTAHAYFSWAPVVAILGGVGTGKSREGLEVADHDCRQWARNAVAFTRKVGADLFSSTLPIFLDEVCHLNQIPEWRPHQIGGATMFYPNGSRMVWFGLDRPGKALSAQYGSAVIEQAEELEDEERKSLEGRIRLRRRPAILEGGRKLPLRRRTTYLFNAFGDGHWADVAFGYKAMQRVPSDPSTWEYRKVIKTTEPIQLFNGSTVPAGHPVAEVLIHKRSDNAENLPPDYQLRLKAQFKGPYYARVVEAVIGSFEGQAFPQFSEQVHVRDGPPEEWGWGEWGGYPPPWWKRYRSIDFGYAADHAFVMTWTTRVPPEYTRYPNAWVDYQEIYMTGEGYRLLHGVGGTVPVHAVNAKAMDAEEVAALNRAIERWNTEHPQARKDLLRRRSFSMQVADHDAGDRAILQGAGIVTDPAVKDRESGYQEVYKALELHKNPHTGEMEPHYVFLRNARREIDPTLRDRNKPTCTWQEFSRLQWAKAPPSGDKPAKDDIVKADDHGYDKTKNLLRTFRDRGDMRVVRLYEHPRDEDD